MRIDRFVSNNFGLSRKEVHRWIKAGRVRVNDTIVRDPGHRLLQNHQVTVDGQELAAAGPVYLMLHKPRGYVCATRDSQHPTVLDLLPRELSSIKGLQVVGRLDLDTTGLLLLTTDGQWNHRLTSPNRCSKTYRVTLAQAPSEDALNQLRQGLVLRNESQPTLPCQIKRIDLHLCELHIKEGRYHQVKRMFAAVGNKVVALHRIRVGAIVLPDELEPGQFRALSATEIIAT